MPFSGPPSHPYVLKEVCNGGVACRARWRLTSHALYYKIPYMSLRNVKIQRYESNLRVIFQWWPKLCTGFNLECERDSIAQRLNMFWKFILPSGVSTHNFWTKNLKIPAIVLGDNKNQKLFNSDRQQRKEQTI